MATTVSQTKIHPGVHKLSAVLTAQDDTVNFQMPRCAAMSIQAEGVSAGDIDLKASNDGTNFYALPTAITFAADGIASVALADLGYLHYQILLKTASESVTVTVIGMEQR